MRCPTCNDFYTPDLERCPGCGGSLTELGSPFRRYSRAIAASRRAWDGWQPSAGVPGLMPSRGMITSAAVDTDMAPAVASSAMPRIEATSLGFLNLFLLHAGHSPLTSLRVDGLEPAGSDDRLILESSPAVFEPVRVPLGPGKTVLPPRVIPELAAFRRRDESTSGVLRASIQRGARTIATWQEPVTVQAANEWISLPAGAASLACAITPNSAAVADLLAGMDTDLLSYQRPGIEAVKMEVKAVYEAVGRLGIRYLPEPPSFDRTGQKVLSPDEVIERRQGCCVDISVLTCALLERSGYNPLVLLVHEHAFAGVWTSDIRSLQPLLHDRGRVRQAIAEGDLLVWNSTSYFGETADRGFEAARVAAEAELGTLRYAIDVAACRYSRFPCYKPLPRLAR